MKKRNCMSFALSTGLFILFILYTAALRLVDVKPIGPQNSLVGFARLNKSLHDFLGVNMQLYTITDWLGLAAVLVALGFAVLGAIQLIKRKSLLRVDHSILALGGFYLLVGLVYLFFEYNIINYRPVLINGILEASYPSSTTMLVMCIMPTAMLQFRQRLQNSRVRACVQVLCGAFTAFMVMARLASGVHWFTDVLGGALLSAALVMLYYAVERLLAFEFKQ